MQSTLRSIALAAVLCLFAAPAYAAPTKVTWPVFIKVQAAPHTVNHIVVHYDAIPDGGAFDWDHTIVDSAGVTTRVTDPPSCYPIERAGAAISQPPGKAVFCPDGTGIQ